MAMLTNQMVIYNCLEVVNDLPNYVVFWCVVDVPMIFPKSNVARDELMIADVGNQWSYHDWGW